MFEYSLRNARLPIRAGVVRDDDSMVTSKLLGGAELGVPFDSAPSTVRNSSADAAWVLL